MSDSSNGKAFAVDDEGERALVRRLIARTDLTERDIDRALDQIRTFHDGKTEWQQRVERALRLVTDQVERVFWTVVRARALVPAIASFAGALLAVILVSAIAYWYYGERVDAVLKLLAAR